MIRSEIGFVFSERTDSSPPKVRKIWKRIIRYDNASGGQHNHYWNCTKRRFLQYRPFYNASTSRNPFLDFSAKRKISFWIQIILIWIPHIPPKKVIINKKQRHPYFDFFFVVSLLVYPVLSLPPLLSVPALPLSANALPHTRNLTCYWFSFVNTVALNFWSLPYPEKLKMENKGKLRRKKRKLQSECDLATRKLCFGESCWVTLNLSMTVNENFCSRSAEWSLFITKQPKQRGGLRKGLQRDFPYWVIVKCDHVGWPIEVLVCRKKQNE